MPSNTTQQLLVAGLEEAAAALPAPCRHVSELHHQRLAQEQEAAARLAALTPFPPSLTLSQEARDQVFAVSIALGTSLPLLVMSQPTRRVTLITINDNLYHMLLRTPSYVFLVDLNSISYFIPLLRRSPFNRRAHN
jgi:hypothetical protein